MEIDILFALTTILGALLTHSQKYENENQGLHEWAIYVPKGLKVAQQVAEDHDLELLDEIIEGTNYFHVRHHKPPAHFSKNHSNKQSTNGAHKLITKKIILHKDVEWVEQQAHTVRVKRDCIIGGHDHEDLEDLRLNDPLWKDMWYLNRKNDFTMNVKAAWKMGVSGKGVTVTIVDDGIESDHPDLIANYDPLASTDIIDNDNDPQPRYGLFNPDDHGTRCAGQVAASLNNSFCAVGIAYQAKIGGIRLLDNKVNDAREARALSFNSNHVDIYSCSWGPNDNGRTMSGPGKLAKRALRNGVKKGRNGKGSIFVWSSGNGGENKDNCNCDGHVNSMYTISISSTLESGQIPSFSEACSSTLATTYSSVAQAKRQIITTDLNHTCTIKHGGTSASAPMASAIIALALEANPSLTWRDVQHIIVRTAHPANLNAPDWQTNGMGRKVSHSYGYGLMDAGNMVKIAKRWNVVPKQEKCIYRTPDYKTEIPARGNVTLAMTVISCPGVNHLEHVVSLIHVRTGRKRGDLKIYLQSPAGTRSLLLDTRPRDLSQKSIKRWPFMTTHNWGENPKGKWYLEVHNNANSILDKVPKIFKWSLNLHGIMFDPNMDASPSN